VRHEATPCAAQYKVLMRPGVDIRVPFLQLRFLYWNRLLLLFVTFVPRRPMRLARNGTRLRKLPSSIGLVPLCISGYSGFHSSEITDRSGI